MVLRGEAIGGKMKLRILMTGVLCLFVAGCATDRKSWEGSPPPIGAAGSGGGAPAPARALQVTKYVQAASEWPDRLAPTQLATMYTSAFIEFDDSATGSMEHVARDYDAESYSWFTRLFFGTRVKTLTAVANLEIAGQVGKLSIPVPLFSITHSSVRDVGETFTTNFVQSKAGSPLFLMGPTTSVSVGFASGVSDEAKSEVAAQVVGKVIELVALVDPKAQIITDLSKPAVNTASRAIDNAISGLINKKIQERVDLVGFTDSWRRGSSFVAVASVPWNLGKTSEDLTVGKWTVSLRCPRPSAFSERNVCAKALAANKAAIPPVGTVDRGGLDDADFAELYRLIAADTKLHPSSILNTILTGDTTIRTFINTATWHDGYIKRQKREKEDHVDFCKNLMAAISTQGFNDFDSVLVLRAAIENMPSLARFSNDLKTFCAAEPKKWGIELAPESAPAPRPQPQPQPAQTP